MYPEIEKGLKNELRRTVQFTGLFHVNIVSQDETDPQNYIKVFYLERVYAPDGETVVTGEEKYYEETLARAVRWATKEIPGTGIQVGNHVIIPAINAYLTEELL